MRLNPNSGTANDILNVCRFELKMDIKATPKVNDKSRHRRQIYLKSLNSECLVLDAQRGKSADQTVPAIVNECFERYGLFVRHFSMESGGNRREIVGCMRRRRGFLAMYLAKQGRLLVHVASALHTAHRCHIRRFLRT